jgi:hypothetical protein
LSRQQKKTKEKYFNWFSCLGEFQLGRIGFAVCGEFQRRSFFSSLSFSRWKVR